MFQSFTSLDWVKISATIIGRQQKIKNNTGQYALKQSPKAKFGSKYKWFKNSYLEFFFWKYNFGHKTFLYSSTGSSGHNQRFFFNFQIFEKSPGQETLAKKISYFTVQFPSKNLAHCTNLNSLHIEINMLRQHNQKPFLLRKFCSTHVSVWYRKKTFALHHFLTPKSRILEALW